jgi:biotin synthase-related radical SAM superfamily protein
MNCNDQNLFFIENDEFKIDESEFDEFDDEIGIQMPEFTNKDDNPLITAKGGIKSPLKDSIPFINF